MSLIKLICYGKSAANGGCRRCDERLILIDREHCWGFAAQWGCRGKIRYKGMPNGFSQDIFEIIR